jgi:hypothetical protein
MGPPLQWSRRPADRPPAEVSEAAMWLDLFYLAIGVLSVVLCWAFVKACDRL